MADQGGVNLSHRVNTWKASSGEEHGGAGQTTNGGGIGGEDTFYDDGDTTLVGSTLSISVNKGKAKLGGGGGSANELGALNEGVEFHPTAPPVARTTATFTPHHSHTSSTTSAFSYAPTSPLNLAGAVKPLPIPNISASMRHGSGSATNGRPSFATDGVTSTSSGKGVGVEMSQIVNLNRQGSSRAPSLHSQKSSVAPDLVFGTKPVGTIGKHKPREIIRVDRDYGSGDLYCQFFTGWIWELEGRISPTDFQNTLNEFNSILASAHDPYKNWMDNCLAVLTFYLSPYFLTSHYDREMKRFDKALEQANRVIFNPNGLNILHPRKSALLFLEIEYY